MTTFFHSALGLSVTSINGRGLMISPRATDDVAPWVRRPEDPVYSGSALLSAYPSPPLSEVDEMAIATQEPASPAPSESKKRSFATEENFEQATPSDFNNEVEAEDASASIKLRFFVPEGSRKRVRALEQQYEGSNEANFDDNTAGSSNPPPIMLRFKVPKGMRRRVQELEQGKVFLRFNVPKGTRKQIKKTKSDKVFLRFRVPAGMRNKIAKKTQPKVSMKFRVPKGMR